VAALDDLDGRLDAMLSGWRSALRTALAGESVRQSLRDMTPAERKPIETFLASADDDPVIPDKFVQSVNRALRGIQALALDPAELLAALRAGGLPCTVEDMMTRFGAYIAEILRGHDKAATRLTLSEKGE